MNDRKFTLEDFNYNLPEELIAQHPTENRADSRLLVQTDQGFLDQKFTDITHYLKEGDLLILNNSKVIKARIELIKNDSKIVMYLNKSLPGQQQGFHIWQAFVRNPKKISVGEFFAFGQHQIEIISKYPQGEVEIKFHLKGLTLEEFLDQYGQIPLPPYIRGGQEQQGDQERYQTVFAAQEGSVAAPTAGLHFTEEIINQIKEKGVKIAYITLHVGAGTYLPVLTSNIDEHKMHSEICDVPQETINLIRQTKENKGRVVAVGTTCVRSLEAWAQKRVSDSEMFETDIFIKPGFDFKVVDCLVTNFHTPKSTLLMLVSAFAGYEKIMELYAHAVQNKYRFFSYGDANFIYRKIK